jgi:PAS domain S-box-containing protein
MSADELSRYIDAMHQRAAALSGYVERAAIGPQPPGAIEELHTALEELRVAEEELREQTEELAATRQAVEWERQRYQDLFEFAPDGYLVTNTAGAIEAANRAAAHLLGVGAQQLIGKPLAVFVALEDRPSFRERIGSLVADGQAHAWELRLVSRQGRTIEVAVTVAAVNDEMGRPSALRWMLRDIGERKRAEAEIRALNTDLERRVADRTTQLEAAQRRMAFLDEASGALGASLDEPTILLSLARLCVPTLADYCLVFSRSDGRSLRPAAVAHAGSSREALVRALAGLADDVAIAGASSRAALKVLNAGQPSLSLTESDLWLVTGARSAEALALFRELGCASYMVLPLLARDQTLGALALVAAESRRHYAPADLALADELARRAALAMDNARLFQEAEAAIQVRNDFLASVSHDLRTPLTGLRGVVQLLQRRLRRGAQPDYEAITQALATIDEAGHRMATLIDELVDLGLLQAGKPPLLDLKPTDLIALARAAIDRRRRMSSRHELRLRADEETLVGRWDAPRLERVLDNLLDNAVKYSPAGGEITVTAAGERDASGRWARLTVADQGIGIPAADLPHIFRRFHRGSNVVGRISGAGIGLATVFHLGTSKRLAIPVPRPPG